MPRGRRGRPGLVGTMARTAVVAGTATAVVGHSQNKQAAKQADAQQDAAQQQQIADMQAQLDQQAQQAAIDAAVAEQLAAAQAAPLPRHRHLRLLRLPAVPTRWRSCRSWPT